MTIPKIHGLIDRRILLNYRIEPTRVGSLLPSPFRPKLVRGHAIGGVCLIRLRSLRPRGVPGVFGFTSENAAHRFAVEWDEEGEVRSGVYISHGVTDSRFVALAGGRIFPGLHELATFSVHELDGTYRVGYRGGRGMHDVAIAARVSADGAGAFGPGGATVFTNLDEASRFFEEGSLGFSLARGGESCEGLELRCVNWSMRPLRIESVRSAFFEDRERFPAGTAELDSALLMERIEHEWRHAGSLAGSPLDVGAG